MDAKAGARTAIERVEDRLINLSHRIHAEPELGFEELRASAWLTDALTDFGFTVETGVGDLPTAFIARRGDGPLHVAICAEYDALPGIGHACGHNVIAASALGAAVGAAAVADDVGLTVSVIGTPAEEGGGGKIFLLERGAFDGQHLAMMAHPAPYDIIDPVIIAAVTMDVRYTGKESHAAAAPELGINAADALTVAQTAIGLLRQHIRASDRVHGIITRGGDAPNIVPAHTEARYMARAETLESLGDIQTRVLRCFEAGALATGATLEVANVHPPYAHMVHDRALAAAYRANAEAVGRKFSDLGAERARFAASTDMGNVSLALPAIHPMVGIGSLPAVNHQPEFAAHCVTSEADRALMDSAIALAWTAIDGATDAALRDRLMRPTGGRR
ncbi:MAG TPA: M20 family metallopeptidase [Chloroflexota bacterium]|nr:M20 family metallopeptidase [Chloroflexota bacterium]